VVAIYLTQAAGERLPLLDRRGGCAIKRCRASDRSRADGVVVLRESLSNLNHHPASHIYCGFAKSLDVLGTPPGQEGRFSIR
jgi:hypothetical protein